MEREIGTGSVATRRGLIRGAGATAFAIVLGLPGVSHARSDVIRIGHLTPRSGPLAPFGDHAVMGIELAADELNAAGGVNGRKIQLLLEDSAEPLSGEAKAQRLVEHDGVALLVGEIPSADELSIMRMTVRLRTVFVVTGHRPCLVRSPARCRYMFDAATLNSPVPRGYADRFNSRYGKPPESRSWSDYCALKIAAEAMAAVRSVDSCELAGHLRRKICSGLEPI